MKKLLEAINRGILKGLNELNIELLSDLDDENLNLLDSILTKDVNNQYNAIRHQLQLAIRHCNITSRLKLLINDPKNFSKFKGLIKANDKEHLKQLIKIGLKLFGNDGNFNWIDTIEITDMSGLFDNSDFNGHIELWDVSNVTDMSYMFRFTKEFNMPLDRWDVSNVTNMRAMFCCARVFNLPIGGWNVCNVTTMANMFNTAESFNLPINNWDVSNVEDMYCMFHNCPIKEEYKPNL